MLKKLFKEQQKQQESKVQLKAEFCRSMPYFLNKAKSNNNF